MSYSIESLGSANVLVKDFSVNVVDIPFKDVVHLPFGAIDSRPSVIAHVSGEVDDKTAAGWAEGTSLPMQIPLYDDYRGNLDRNVSNILGSIKGMEATLDQIALSIGSLSLEGNFATARLAAEAALIDMAARGIGIAVIDALLGRHVERPIKVPYGKSIAEVGYQKVLTSADNAINAGATRLKFKISPQSAHSVLPALKKIINEYSTEMVMVDANGMFDPESKEHIDILREIDSIGLSIFEEPVSRAGRVLGVKAHELLRDKIDLRTPVAADDAVVHVEDAEYIIDQDLADIISIKPGRVGSFFGCLKIIKKAREAGKQVMVGGMYEATPGRMLTVTLDAYCHALGFKIPGDTSLPSERLAFDLLDSDSALTLDDDHNIIFSPSKGWGYSL